MTAPLVKVPYFKDVCCDILAAFMARHGFTIQNNDKFDGVIFKKESLVVQISYWPEDFPDYIPVVNICYTDGKNFSGVGLWKAIPESADVNYSSWQFRNEDELRASIIKLRDKVLAVYSPQLWQDNFNLKRIISESEAYLLQEEENRILNELKERATVAFKAGDYKEAISLYSKLPQTSLSQIDLKRISISKKRIGEIR